MPDIPLGRSAYERSRGNLPRLPVVNYIAEKSPTEKGGVTYQSRRGKSQESVVGTGPVRAIYQEDGVLSGVRIVVSAGLIYADGVQIGVVNGSAPVSIAGNSTQILIASGSTLYRYDGTTYGAVSFPDGANVSRVAYLAGYFLAVRAGTQRVYFSALGQGNLWDGLDYFAAENEPDMLVDMLVANDLLVLIGTRSTEFFIRTGQADLPFQSVQQRVFEYGAIAAGCAVTADNTHFWIGDDGIFYRAGNVPEPVSDDGHTADILASGSWSVFLVRDERHKLICIRLDTKTLVFNITSGLWSEFSSIGRVNWRVACANGALMGDDETGHIWEFGGYLDAGQPIERRISAGFVVDGGTVPVRNVRLRHDVGQTDFLTGEYDEPIMEARFSDDGGQTYTGWLQASMGRQGEYRTMIEWRALGAASFPGRIFEFRTTAPVSSRITGALINEMGGGRSR